ncbi:MAG TPA: hypothetical protein VFD59_20135 [Nocardioidaceae bacterium]|nr:hypothetical protein [Nocardioidaceae bacterium]
MQAILAERDPGRLVRMWVDILLEVGARRHRSGPSSSPRPTSIPMRVPEGQYPQRKPDRRHRVRPPPRRHRRPAQNVSIERGADTCWALVNSLLPHLLVTTRGWSLEEYGEWLVRVVSTMLSSRSLP